MGVNGIGYLDMRHKSYKFYLMIPKTIIIKTSVGLFSTRADVPAIKKPRKTC